MKESVSRQQYHVDTFSCYAKAHIQLCMLEKLKCFVFRKLIFVESPDDFHEEKNLLDTGLDSMRLVLFIEEQLGADKCFCGSWFSSVFARQIILNRALVAQVEIPAFGRRMQFTGSIHYAG